jgi:hypothetical protein
LIRANGEGAATGPQAIEVIEAVFPGLGLSIRTESHHQIGTDHYWDIELPTQAVDVICEQGWGEFGQEHHGLIVVGNPE